MRLANAMIAVTDMERSKAFYKNILGMEIEGDFGANVLLKGGVSLQTLESWPKFINKTADDIKLKNYSGELYFETDDFDGFTANLARFEDVVCVVPAHEHTWGQRAVTIYDPDEYIIEIGENIDYVCRRFVDSGMTVEQTAVRMDVPEDYVKACLERVAKSQKKA